MAVPEKSHCATCLKVFYPSGIGEQHLCTSCAKSRCGACYTRIGGCEVAIEVDGKIFCTNCVNKKKCTSCHTTIADNEIWMTFGEGKHKRHLCAKCASYAYDPKPMSTRVECTVALNGNFTEAQLRKILQAVECVNAAR